MPLLRYFVYVGGTLLVLLFVVTWSLPPLPAEPGRNAADRSIIRIHSQHKWPSAVVIDTTLPTIVPAPVVAQAAAATPPLEPRSPRDALALAQTADVPAAVTAHPATPRPVTRRARAPRPPAGYVASYESFGFRPLFATGW
jgi:hypothetical protein